MGTVKLKLEWPFLGVGNQNEQTSSCVIHRYSGKMGTGALPPVKLPLSKVRCRDIHQYKAVFTLVPHAGSGSTHSRPKQDKELCSHACSFSAGAGALPLCCLAWAPARGWCVQGSRMLRPWHWSDFLSKMLVPALQVLHMAPRGCLPLAATGVLLKTPELWYLSKIRRGESACVWDRWPTPKVSDIWAEGWSCK